MVSGRLQYTLAKEIVRGEIKKEEVREAFFENDAIGWREFERQYLNNVDYIHRRQLLLTHISYYVSLAQNDAHMLREVSQELDKCTQSLANLKRGNQLQSMLDFYKDDPKAQARMRIIYADVERSYQESVANKRMIQSGLQKDMQQLNTSIERYQKQIEEGDGMLLLDIIGVL